MTVAIFKLGRELPVKAFLSGAVVLLMATSIAFLGNAVYALQAGRRRSGTTGSSGWPRLPIYLAQATGYYPTRETVSAQVALLAVYLLGRALDVRGPPDDAAAPPPADPDRRRRADRGTASRAASRPARAPT